MEEHDQGSDFLNIWVAQKGKVGIISLHRPQSLNALSHGLISDLCEALEAFENDPHISVIILKGSEKAFSVGVDIKEMAPQTYIDAYVKDFTAMGWDRIMACRKPLIAAVAGYALGGGCEIALICDIILAADTAVFAQPEITIGTIPGGGATQRWPRIVGKSKAMEMCLTGRFMNAIEAERCGLVSRVVPFEKLDETALELAEKIAEMSLPVVMMIKESVSRAYESPLKEGLLFERQTFHSTFALQDQKEGMVAFIEKRKPQFKGQ